jgi:hypothetical protein
MGSPTHPTVTITKGEKDLNKGREDAFGDLRAQVPTPLLTQPSHYAANPERHRIYVGGNRQLLQYNSPSQYEHAGDVHRLKPNPGETVAIETAEKPRYTVQFDLEYSFAFGLSQELQAGDLARFGVFDGQNGYFFERRGNQEDRLVDFVVLREGTEVLRRAGVEINREMTAFQRWSLETNWYNVGSQRWKQTYTAGFTQRNEEVATTSIDDGGRGPVLGNLPLRMEVQASGSTTGLVLNAGSFGASVIGNVTSRERQKGGIVEFSCGGTGDWEPLYAFRLDPERAPISAMFGASKILSFSGGETCEVMVCGHDKSKVLGSNGNPIPDSDWGYDNYRSPLTSAVQTATPDKAPNDSGTPVRQAGKTGGWQAEYAVISQGGARIVSTNADPKASIYDRDVYVLWARSLASGTGEFFPAITEEW